MSQSPERIVCLSAETADWLWRIGAWDRVAGITAFFHPPPEAPAKPRVSGFSSAHLEKIEALHPDLVITFSDVQAKIAGELIQYGISVLGTNQRTLSEIEETLAMLARIADCEKTGAALLQEFRKRLTPVEFGRRPRVYFEEWDEPSVAGIAWVSELVERAGGEDIFRELREKRASADRVVSSEQVRRSNPEIIFASWCGKRVQLEQIARQPRWGETEAVRAGRIYEIPGDDILQPGFRLVNGYDLIRRRIAEFAASESRAMRAR